MPVNLPPRPRRAIARRSRWAALAGAAALLVPFATLAQSTDAAGATADVQLFSGAGEPKLVSTAAEREVGVKFTTASDGIVRGVSFYKGTATTSGGHRVILWNTGGKILAKAHFTAAVTAGWQRIEFPSPVAVGAGTSYVVSYYTPSGNYAETPGALAAPVKQGPLTATQSLYRAGRGFPKTASTANFWVEPLFSYQTTDASPEPTVTPKPTPTPTATPRPTSTPTAPPTATPTPTVTAPIPVPTPAPTATPAPTGWPNASNTGVPAGVTLSTYSGPFTITADNTVIRNQVVNGSLRIQASNVQIINSRINGSVDLRDPKTTDYSFTITDSEVHVGDNLNTGIMRGNFRATRVEVTGGRRSIYCVSNCVVEDSFVHLQGGDPGGDAHFSGVRMEQNGTFRHNTLICEAARGSGTGCSAALTGYGDFAPVQNNLIENNIFIGSLGGGSTMCAYGGSSGADGGKPYGHLARDIRFINNVFTRGTSGKCGNLGAVAGFDASRPGNLWQGNTWDDGSTIRPN